MRTSHIMWNYSIKCVSSQLTHTAVFQDSSYLKRGLVSSPKLQRKYFLANGGH